MTDEQRAADRARARRYYLDHRDKRTAEQRELGRAACRRWYARNRDRELAKDRAYRERTREKCLAARRRLRIANHDKLLAQAAAYREKHREELNARQRAWAKRNPDKAYAGVIRRRVRKRAAYEMEIAPRDIFERDGWICQLCGEAVDRKLPGRNVMGPTIDHIIPLGLGGKHRTSNVQLAHRSCNSRKKGSLWFIKTPFARALRVERRKYVGVG